MLFSQTFYGLLFSYLTITDVTPYVHHKFPVSILLYIATKSIKTNHYCSVQFYECSYHKKNNSCTRCVPMFSTECTIGMVWELTSLINNWFELYFYLNTVNLSDKIIREHERSVRVARGDSRGQL